MAKDDLQVGDTWTHEAWRRRGLASAALEFAVRANRKPGRVFWYVTNADNVASIRVVERCSFVQRATGRRTSCLGLRLLGAFVPAPTQ